MTQIFTEKGNVVPVTVVKAGPCVVTQIRNEKTDGYTAVQIGFGNKNKLSKTLQGHFKGLGKFQYVKEFRDSSEVKIGDQITVETFEAGDKVKVTGTSKGKGFQGVVKRHGFGGAKATHGTKDQLRMPGSIGATGPAHVFKGQKMPGQMGNHKTTITNLEIVQVDSENGLLYIKGAIPGPKNSLVMVHGEGDIKIAAPESATQESVEQTEGVKPEVADEKVEASQEVTEEKKDAEEKKEEAK